MILKDRLKKARMGIVFRHPWWSSLVLRLGFVVDDQYKGYYAATNGRIVRFFAGLCDDLTDTELEGLICHEALHCGFQHPARRLNRDHDKWNAACDYAIDQLLVESGLEVPNPYLDDKYLGMSAEEIYDKLPDNYKGKKGGKDGIEDGDADPQWTETVVQAIHEAYRRGRLSQDSVRQYIETLTPTLSWRELLCQFIHKVSGGEDYRWHRPNRRGLALDLYLPSLYATECRPIAVCIDTSGSISNDILTRFINETRSLISQARPINTIIIYCDADVKQIDEVEAGDEYTPRPKGGGGTAFEPALSAAEKFDPACAIYLTDGEGSFGEAPTFPVIWALVGQPRSFETPYGENIHVEME